MLQRIKDQSFLYIIPLIVGLLAILLRWGSGPFWLGTNLDPSYLYFVNSLYLLKGFPPLFTDHPGTPLQILCATIVTAFHLGESPSDTIRSAVMNPEFYLQALYSLLWLFFIGSLIFVGHYVYRKSGRKDYALIAQAPAFCFLTLKSYSTGGAILPVIANINAEPLLITVMNFFVVATVKLYYAKPKKEILRTALLWGIICGLGESVKFTFTPVLLAPLILLPGLRQKAVFLGVTVAAFALFTIPIWPNYPRMFGWLSGIMNHTGFHGSGPEGFLDAPVFVKNLLDAILQNPLFFGITVAALAANIRCKTRSSFFVCTIASSILLSFLMVAKQNAPHYMTASLALTGILCLFSLENIPSSINATKKIIRSGIALFIIMGTTLSFAYAIQVKRWGDTLLAFDKRIHTQYPQCQIIGLYRSSGKEMALRFGDYISQMKILGDELEAAYPNKYFFHYPMYRISNYKKYVGISHVLRENPCVLFRGPKYDFSVGPYDVEKIEESGGEHLYRLIRSHEDEALYMYLAAVSFEKKGDFLKAYLLAMKCKQLRMQPPEFIDEYLSHLREKMSAGKFP